MHKDSAWPSPWISVLKVVAVKKEDGDVFAEGISMGGALVRFWVNSQRDESSIIVDSNLVEFIMLFYY